eukprot:gene18125-24570_t
MSFLKPSAAVLALLRNATRWSKGSCAAAANFDQHSLRGFGTGTEQVEEGAEEISGRPTTPWVRQVISGVDLMRHPKYNKGLAFSDSERDRLYIRGLLPPAVLSQEVQLERIIMNIRSKEGNLDKFSYMQSLQERSERLFYRVLVENLEELMPIVYDPTVRVACRKNSLMFKSVPRALFISLEDRGRVFRILKNWPERNIRLVVLSDGERVIGVGDIGVQGPAQAWGTAHRPPERVPGQKTAVVGADRQPLSGAPSELLRSPFYVGLRHPRQRGDSYYELLDEVLTAIQQRYGNTAMLQFEGMAYENASKLLNMYRTEFPCFNDDMTGIATAVLASILGAWPKTGTQLGDHIFLFSGDGAIGACAAELIAAAIAAKSKITVLEARKNIWLVDGSGLVTRERGDSSTLESYKLPFCHSGPAECDLLAVETLKPTVLVACSSPTVLVGCCSEGAAAPYQFTKEIIQKLAANTRNPIVLPLSGDSSEASPADIYEWSEGRALVATDSRMEPVTMADGQIFEPSNCSSLYIFPGVGLGTLISKCTKLRDEQFIAAAEAVARMVTEDELDKGSVLPHTSRIREVSAHVATAVASKAYTGGYATALPKPHNLQEVATRFMYNPAYKNYR